MIDRAQDVLSEPFSPEVFLGLASERLRLQVARMAPHFRVALVLGEHGTGKRTVAETMHRLSPVAALPFTSVPAADFAAGMAVVPGTGTLLLERLDELPAALQTALLERLRVLPRELRLLAASATDPRGMVAAGRLEPGVHSALATLEIRVPSLRERAPDLAEIACSMLRRAAPAATLGDEALLALTRHPWPGNLAELWQTLAALRGTAGVVAAAALNLRSLPLAPPSARLDDVLQRHVIDVLERCGGNKLRAAELLGISRSTLYRMLDQAPRTEP